MANHCNHSKKRNSTNQFYKLDMRKVSTGFPSDLGEIKGSLVIYSDGYRLEITSTPCNYGGYRYWWKCPGCGGRFACLYRHNGDHKCRHCLNAVHPSTQSTKNDRSLNQMWKIIKRYGLDADGFTTLGAWHKPKRMHWKTWWRIQDTHHKYQIAALARLEASLPKRRYYGQKPSG